MSSPITMHAENMALPDGADEIPMNDIASVGCMTSLATQASNTAKRSIHKVPTAQQKHVQATAPGHNMEIAGNCCRHSLQSIEPTQQVGAAPMGTHSALRLGRAMPYRTSIARLNNLSYEIREPETRNAITTATLGLMNV